MYIYVYAYIYRHLQQPPHARLALLEQLDLGVGHGGGEVLTDKERGVHVSWRKGECASVEGNGSLSRVLSLCLSIHVYMYIYIFVHI